MHTQARATLDSLTRLTVDLRLGLAPAVAARLRPHKLLVALVALLAALIGGALPVLVFGMNPKSAERVGVDVRALPLGRASLPPAKPSPGAGGRGQPISKHQADPDEASPPARSKVQAAPARRQSSSGGEVTGSHAAAASVQGSDETAAPESSAAPQSAPGQEAADSNAESFEWDGESSGQDEDSQGDEHGKGNGKTYGHDHGNGNGEGMAKAKAKGHDKHDGH